MCDDYPQIVIMEQDVDRHGEVHAVVEECDQEVEIRQGTANFEYMHGVITLDPPSQPLERIGMGRIISWYLPEDGRH